MIKSSPYKILGLEGDFEFKDIKKAYRKKVQEFSPDRYPEEFATISDAYETLTNEEYFAKMVNSIRFVLDVSIDIEESKKEDNSKYLKNIFEVPFKI